MHTERERELRRKFKKTHPEANRKHNKTYRARHKIEMAEYNRLNPELRIRLPLAMHEIVKLIPRRYSRGDRKGSLQTWD